MSGNPRVIHKDAEVARTGAAAQRLLTKQPSVSPGERLLPPSSSPSSRACHCCIDWNSEWNYSLKAHCASVCCHLACTHNPSASSTVKHITFSTQLQHAFADMPHVEMSRRQGRANSISFLHVVQDTKCVCILASG